MLYTFAKIVQLLLLLFFFFANVYNICHFLYVYNVSLHSKTGLLSILLKNVAKCSCSKTIQQNILILKLDFLKIEFYIETRFLENQVIGDQTFKKKKN